MAESDPSPYSPAAVEASPSVSSPVSSHEESEDDSKPIGTELAEINSDEKKEDFDKIGAKFAELDESQSELLSRLQKLKDDMENWRLSLDKQVTTYKDELKTMRAALDTELDQLRTGFKELRTTLQKQQEDVTESLRGLGMMDVSDTTTKTEETRDPKDNQKEGQATTAGNSQVQT